MRVPTTKGERADARTVGLRQELCGGANGLGEVGPQLREVGGDNLANRRLPHTASRRNCRELWAAFKDAGESDVRVPREIEQGRGPVAARRREPASGP